MELKELLLELFGRIDEHVHEAVDGLDPDLLVTAPAEGANPIAWLVWHLARVQDSHIAEILEEEQVWMSGDWVGRFGVVPDPADTGYAHSWHDVKTIQPVSPSALIEYYEAVAACTNEFLEGLTATDLDRIVDRNWDPPVTLGARLVSIADDDIQHSGQAAYVRGLLESRR
jgi:uncharacterized damage-inducible protein DinB